VPRLKRNIGLLLVNLLLLLGGLLVLPYPAVWERASVASAWLCMLLLSAVLLLAPLQRLQGRQPPLNIYLRRDLGCWAAIQGLLHFVAGNVVAMNPVYVGTFVRGNTAAPGPMLREVLFSGGAILGMVIAILFLLLLAISSDRAIRWLGPARWKKLQGSAQLLMWLTVIHGIAYQVLEARFIPLLVLLLTSIIVLTIRSRAVARLVVSQVGN